jgi:hypothetical protein
LKAAAGWTTADPVLSTWSSAGEIAAACRGASPLNQDLLLGALLGVAAGDELAQLTVVAGLTDRLRRVRAGWARAGAAAWELPGLGAELVSGCWAATTTVAELISSGGSVPSRLGLHLVDEAREAVRVPRRRLLRARARTVAHTDSPPAPVSGQPTVEVLAREIVAAVRDGRISIAAARPVFLTRVIGYDTTEAARRLGCTPAVLRAIRSRAERRLSQAA